jgi:oligopeptide transport system ATP-binding protein
MAGSTPEDGHVVPGQTLVQARDLRVGFRLGGGMLGGAASTIRAVDGVDLDVERGETLGLVGESGCGKSTLGRALIGMQGLASGTVTFDGRVLASLRAAELRRLRRRMQMVFQDPYGSLDPRMRVRAIVAEPLSVHGLARGTARTARVAALLETVGLNPEHGRRLPRELSGGQQQRVGIARALAAEPDFIVCDEPVSALDVSIQAQVLNLLTALREELALTMLFISHDLSVVKHMSDRVAIMYLGKVVELGPTRSVYRRPGHPYTEALMSAVPLPDPVRERTRRRITLRGELPSPADPPSGCRFHTRCWLYERLDRPERCRTTEPDFLPVDAGHRSACHYAAESRRIAASDHATEGRQ